MIEDLAMISKLDSMIAFERNALGLRVQRQQVLATNIANADTPFFQARDIDFSSALNDAMSGRASNDGVDLARTNNRHIAGSGGSGGTPLLYRAATQGSADGNTVDMDIERSAFAENSIQVEALLRFITDDFKGMQMAITGQ